MPLALSEQQTIAIPLVAPAADGGEIALLPIPLVMQTPYVNLCWAACCAMVSQALVQRYPQNFPNLPATVPDIATRVAQSNQCPSDAGVGIDRTCWPDCACGVLGYPCTEWDDYVTAEYLLAEIREARRPVGVYIEWNDDDSHVALVVGSNVDGSVFVVHDPRSVTPQHVSWEWLTTWGGAGKWKKTFYELGYSL